MRALSLVRHDSALAQLVEQMTVNHWVLGSNPRGGAKFKKGCRDAAFFFAHFLTLGPFAVLSPSFRRPFAVLLPHQSF